MQTIINQMVVIRFNYQSSVYKPIIYNQFLIND